MIADGHCSSVAERWQLKPEALGSTPGGATFFLCPLPFQRSTDSNGPWPDCVFQLGTITIGLRTIEESRPLDSSPCLITLVIFHTIRESCANEENHWICIVLACIVVTTCIQWCNVFATHCPRACTLRSCAVHL